MTTLTSVKSYAELRRFETFEERFDYLSLLGYVGEATFGYDRWINQQFYGSRQWKQIRNHVILRDMSCDLGVEGYELHSGLLIHHMNPITAEDIANGDEAIIDPEYLITTTTLTHNAIHYGNRDMLKKPYVERTRNDTRLW